MGAQVHRCIYACSLTEHKYYRRHGMPLILNRFWQRLNTYTCFAFIWNLNIQQNNCIWCTGVTVGNNFCILFKWTNLVVEWKSTTRYSNSKTIFSLQNFTVDFNRLVRKWILWNLPHEHLNFQFNCMNVANYFWP